jgi:ABC-2 type transport system permease protein
MNSLQLARHEFRYERLSFQRDPQALFATIGLPLLYMVIFASLFGGEIANYAIYGVAGPFKAATVMTANFISIGIISAAFYNLGVSLVEARESGVLKRFRATPLPTSAFIGGHVGVAIVLSIGIAVFLGLLGRIAYGVTIPTDTLLALVLIVVISAIAFACLGFAFTVIVQTRGAAAPLGLGLTLTLFFLSGNFFMMENWPTAIRILTNIFPVKHLNAALLLALKPSTSGVGIAWGDLAVVVLWGIGGLLVALRFFRWTPRGG